MTVFVGAETFSWPQSGTAVTIGTFDGVHLGHRALIARTVAAAREQGLVSVGITWDRHPLMTLRPDAAPRLLSSLERKIELLQGTGLDHIVVVEFTEEFSHWSPERFVQDILVRSLNARAVFVGEGWRFGHKRAGDIDLLKKLGEESGFTAEPVDLAAEGDMPVSSTRIREAIAAGQVAEALELLGRRFDVDGEVVHGDDRGASLGFPTANLELDPRLSHPARGVYACRARVDGSWFAAATNVGVNPTFGGDPEITPVRIETFLLGFEGDLYGRTIRVEFWARLRDEMKFTSVDDLITQMKRDVEATKELVSNS